MLATIVVAWSCIVTAQEQKPSTLSPNGALKPTTLLLEVADNSSFPPGYSEVNGPGQTSKWVWLSSARIVYIPGRQRPTGKAIQAIRFEPVLNGETVDVKVTLLRGSKGFEQEDLVGVYRLGIGEQKILSDLDQFSIEPFKITIVNSVPPLPPSPTIQNQTKSVDIISIQQENLPRPAYKLTLQNLSDKNISGVRVEVTMDGRGPGVSLFQGEEGRPLLEPGGTIEKKMPAVMAVGTASGHAPGSGAANVITIRSVVFADLSFEGDFKSACSMESVMMGRRFWLKQMLALLDQELAKANSNHIAAAKQFKEKLSALSFEFEESERNMPSSVLPACPKPADAAIRITNGMRVDLVRELERIISTTSATPLNFKSWMEEKRARYSAWLARL